MQAQEESLWLETGSEAVESEVRQIHVSNGFTRLHADHCCYFKWFENSYIILVLYVDDMLVVESSMKEIVNSRSSWRKNSQ